MVSRGIGKPLFEKWSVYLGIAQIAFDPPPRPPPSVKRAPCCTFSKLFGEGPSQLRATAATCLDTRCIRTLRCNDLPKVIRIRGLPPNPLDFTSFSKGPKVYIFTFAQKQLF